MQRRAGAGTEAHDIPAAPPPVDSLDDAQRERRDRIVQAAVALMLTTEYERIQMKDITARAGVALGTTYRYFTSKDHLMGEALLAWSERFPTEPPSWKGRSVDQLKLAFWLAVRAFEPHPTVYGALLRLQAATDPFAVAAWERFAERQLSAFEGFLPRISPERRSRIVLVMSAVLDVQLRNWVLGRTDIASVYRSLDESADLILGD
jgi:AcrR family transcriptional regulator